MVWMLASCSHGCSPLEERQPLSLVSHNGSGFIETMSSSKKQSSVLVHANRWEPTASRKTQEPG